MKRRLLASLIVAGALAYACGPRSRSTDVSVASFGSTPLLQTSAVARRAATSAAISAPVVHSATATTNRDGIKLDSHFDVQVDAKSVRFAFNVKNVGRKHVELAFPNGQAYDFVVLDSTGTEVWRWAAGRLFTQTVRNKDLSKGNAMHVEEKWSASATSGRFTAIATLKSNNYPVEQRVEFVIPGPVNVATTR
jgi:hypothetical protein